MSFQYDIWFICRIVSWPNTSWVIIIPLVWWYMDNTTKSAAARILINGMESSTYSSCRLYVRTRFHNTWCILSIFRFVCGLPEEDSLVLFLYSFSIKLFLNSLPSNSPPWLYVISTGHRYRTSHVVSTKFVIVIAFLLLYFVISDHPVMGTIIVVAFNIRVSFPFVLIL